MIHHQPLFLLVLSASLVTAYSLYQPTTIAYVSPRVADQHHEQSAAQTQLLGTLKLLEEEVQELQATMDERKATKAQVLSVPFYSQFKDITDPNWKKVGCGIASLAMIVDHYGETDSVDTLLQKGIASGAYINDAGWSHAGLIKLSHAYGLDGKSISLAEHSVDDAFLKLTEAVSEGPVMVSVHYTFEPTNPIPHLVVITNITADTVIYNDPAELAGDGIITAEKFKGAWKKRYIEIRPTI